MTIERTQRRIENIYETSKFEVNKLLTFAKYDEHVVHVQISSRQLRPRGLNLYDVRLSAWGQKSMNGAGNLWIFT